MKILLAPAEIKMKNGNEKQICKENFSFPNIYDARIEVLTHYENLISNSSLEELSIWFGITNLDDVREYSNLY